jgi:isopenicillin-N N-acyltransferase like protein
MKEIMIIKAGGSNYDLGFTVGRTAKSLIEKSVNHYRQILPREEGWSGKWSAPEGCLEAAQEQFPHLIEELQGMAAGSGISFGDLFFLNALEEVLDLKPPAACTSIGLKVDGSVWLGHNEDWYAEDAAAVIAIYGQPQHQPAFFSITAAPFLAAVGMNEAGLAQGVNSVTATDCRIGVPRMFAARAVLEATTIKEAIEKATSKNRAGGYNHLLAQAGGDLGNLETTAEEADYLPGPKMIYHTNHYISQQLQHLAVKGSDHSLARYRRLTELERINKKAGADQRPGGLETLGGFLSDHENRPLSICKHASEQKSHEGTIFSAIFETGSFRAWVAVGNPCGNMYREIKI